MRAAAIFLVVPAALLSLAGCWGGTPATVGERALDSKYLVAQPADLPDVYLPSHSETGPIPLTSVLREPWSAGVRALIRRYRIAGYQAMFVGPEGLRISCSAAVCRSKAVLAQVGRMRIKRFGAFLKSARRGRPIRVGRIGEEMVAFQFRVARSSGFTVVWRFKTVASSCTSWGLSTSSPQQLLKVATAHQARMAAALGRGQ